MDNDDQHDTAQNGPEVLVHVDAAKRASLRKLVIGTAYAVPAIASFSLAGLSTADAAGYVSNIDRG